VIRLLPNNDLSCKALPIQSDWCCIKRHDDLDCRVLKQSQITGQKHYADWLAFAADGSIMLLALWVLECQIFWECQSMLLRRSVLMSLKPLGDRVVVKQDEAETMTATGLVIAATATEKPDRGVVIAVGEGKLDNNCNLIKPQCNVGDTVIYSKYGGTEIKDGDEELIILRADDIYAIVS
jgi:chaperonin GroES